MKRVLTSVLALGIVLGIGATRAHAQSLTFGVGGGATIPTGDFKNVSKLGWHGLADVGYAMSSGLGLRGEFFYGQNSTKSGICPSNVTCRTKLGGGLASVTYDIKTSSGVQPYLLGGVGAFNVKAAASSGGVSASASETKIAFGGGGGFKFKAGSDSHIFIEGRYISVSTSGGHTGFIPVTIGISFGTR
jgi:opacity protein-like surface antigen